MEEFKKVAEDWANKQWINPEHYQVHKDFTDLMMFGSIGYYIDPDGNQRRLTQQELSDMQSNKNVVVTEVNLKEYINRAKKS